MLVEFHRYINTLPNSIVIETSEDSVVFSYNGLSFMFICEEKDDPYYIRLVLPRIWNLEEEKDDIDINMYHKIDQFNNKFKVAKLFFFEKAIWASAEQFVYSKENVVALFARLISLLELLINEFRKEPLQQ